MALAAQNFNDSSDFQEEELCLSNRAVPPESSFVSLCRQLSLGPWLWITHFEPRMPGIIPFFSQFRQFFSLCFFTMFRESFLCQPNETSFSAYLSPGPCSYPLRCKESDLKTWHFLTSLFSYLPRCLSLFLTVSQAASGSNWIPFHLFINKTWYICTMEYYWAIKKNKIMPFRATWMQLEIIMLNDVRRRKIRIMSLICGL